MSFAHPRQSGGTFMGLVIGLVLGLGVALVVAVYVTKAPVPFVDRGILGTTEPDSAQGQKSPNWNPNATFNQNAASPAPATTPEGSNATTPAANSDTPAATPADSAATEQPTASPTAAKSAADPLGDLIQRQAQNSEADAAETPKPVLPAVREAGPVRELVFYVQAGAFGEIGDAENQRAKLALMGVDARVSKDVVNERTIYRVRSGPFRTRGAALSTRQKLTDQNIESVVVAVPK